MFERTEDSLHRVRTCRKRFFTSFRMTFAPRFRMTDAPLSDQNDMASK